MRGNLFPFLALSLFFLLAPIFPLERNLNIPVEVEGPVPYSIVEKTLVKTELHVPYTYLDKEEREFTIFSSTDIELPEGFYWYIGPLKLGSGMTLEVSWDANAALDLYILDEYDWRKRFSGIPVTWRVHRSGASGSVEHVLLSNASIYIQLSSPALEKTTIRRLGAKVIWEQEVIKTAYRTEYDITERTATRTEYRVEKTMKFVNATFRYYVSVLEMLSRVSIQARPVFVSA